MIYTLKIKKSLRLLAWFEAWNLPSIVAKKIIGLFWARLGCGCLGIDFFDTYWKIKVFRSFQVTLTESYESAIIQLLWAYKMAMPYGSIK